MKLTIKAGGVPAGSYVARFLGVEQRDYPQYGPGLLWQFEIVAGPHAGGKVNAMSSPDPTAANKCGRILAGIMNKLPGVGESVDLSTYVGKSFLVIVEQSDRGSRITAVTAPPTAA
jgi:hypothetical protein